MITKIYYMFGEAGLKYCDNRKMLLLVIVKLYCYDMIGLLL